MIERIACLLCLLALPGLAFGQNPQPAPPHETHAPVAAPDSPQPPPEQIAPGGRTSGAVNEDKTLTDKLSRQQGTLHPPAAVDPGIHAPVPSQAGSAMPVIPPPGSPGGNQTVVPK